MSFLLGKKTGIKIRLKNMAIDPKVLMPCLALGLSSFIMQASESVILIAFNSSLLKYGGDMAVGAMTILSSVIQLSMLPTHGLGQGAQPIASYNFGAKNPDRVKQTFKLLLFSTMTFTMSIWLLVMIFPQMFARIFVPNQALVEFTAWALRIYFAAMGVFGLQVACQMTFTAIGNAKASIAVAVLRKFILLVPLIYIIPQFTENKVFGVYLAEPIADFCSVTFTAVLFFFQFRRAMDELETEKKMGEIAAGSKNL